MKTYIKRQIHVVAVGKISELLPAFYSGMTDRPEAVLLKNDEIKGWCRAARSVDNNLPDHDGTLRPAAKKFSLSVI